MISICLHLSSKLKHRGPDDEGFVLFDSSGKAFEFKGDDSDLSLSKPHIKTAEGLFSGALVHRRLSIISPGPAGHQPMHDVSKKKWISYNGETFNFRELDAQFQFKNRSDNDAETVVNLVGESSANHALLDGFHAFALLDPENKKLQLFRDETGVKPLYYLQQNDRFYFASETKALRKYLPDISIDPTAVFHYLTEGISLPGRNYFKNICEVSNALDVDLRDLKTRAYKYTQGDKNPDKPLRNVLDEVVSSRLLSDMPLGFALSGGLDSAIVAGIAVKNSADPSNLKMFGVVSDDPDSDEGEWQKYLANQWKVQYHAVSTNSFQPHTLETFIRTTELPPVAWNNIAQFELAALVKQHDVTVFLNGQGADEIFGGYPDYWLRYFQKEPLSLLSGTWNLPMDKFRMLGEIAKLQLKKFTPTDIAAKVFFRKNKNWISDDFIHEKSFMWSRASMSADAAMKDDYYGQRLRQMLMWEDINGMAHQLESRNPFADSRKLSAWLTLPLESKFTAGFSKGILRDAVQGIVPEKVRLRLDKKGFSVPDTRLNLKFYQHWKEAFFSEEIQLFSPLKKREILWNSVQKNENENLKKIFRLSALSMFIQKIKSE